MIFVLLLPNSSLIAGKYVSTAQRTHASCGNQHHSANRPSHGNPPHPLEAALSSGRHLMAGTVCEEKA